MPTDSPDWTLDIESALSRAGYRLRLNQSLKLFFLAPSSKRLADNPYPWVTDPMAAEGSAHLVDGSTGLATPYTVPEGYSLTLIEQTFYSTSKAAIWLYMDGHVIAECASVEANSGMLDNNVVPYTTTWIDPTAATSHTLDGQVFNLDVLYELEGGFSITAILEAVSTPPLPDTKVVRCHGCGAPTTVPWATSTVRCQECGQTVVVIIDQRMPHRR